MNPAEVDIRFNFPNREWSTSLAGPTVKLYLYYTRENLELRESNWKVEGGANGATKKKSSTRIDLSYLITAWMSNVEDDRRLPWYVLAT